MNKSKLVGIVVVLFLVIGGIYAYVHSQNDKKDLEKKVDELENKASEPDDEKISAKSPEDFGIDEELLTWEEMTSKVNEYVDEDDSLTTDLVADKIEDEYGEYNRIAYEEGLLITENMDDGDKNQILTNLSYNNNIISTKNIANPIDNDIAPSENTEEEDSYFSVYSLMGDNEYGGLFRNFDSLYSDTEGFYDIDGLKIGYPTVDGLEDDDLTPKGDMDEGIGINFLVYNDEELNEKDFNNQIEELKNLQVNGKEIIEDGFGFGRYSITDKEDADKFKEDFTKDNDKNFVIPEESMYKVSVFIPYENLGDNEVKNKEDYQDKKDSDDFSIKLDINGQEFIINKHISEKDTTQVIPEIIE